MVTLLLVIFSKSEDTIENFDFSSYVLQQHCHSPSPPKEEEGEKKKNT